MLRILTEDYGWVVGYAGGELVWSCDFTKSSSHCYRGGEAKSGDLHSSVAGSWWGQFSRKQTLQNTDSIFSFKTADPWRMKVHEIEVKQSIDAIGDRDVVIVGQDARKRQHSVAQTCQRRDH
jgi:hypothetical protein